MCLISSYVSHSIFPAFLKGGNLDCRSIDTVGDILQLCLDFHLDNMLCI